MSTFTATELLNLGFVPGPAVGAALRALNTLPPGQAAHQAAQLTLVLTEVLEKPARYLHDAVWGETARYLLRAQEKPLWLRPDPLPYNVYGEAHIEPQSRAQMDTAMRLPVAVAGALMPDAHMGYGLPIGGVLATQNAVIPYGVGVDIGCRMCLTVHDIPIQHMEARKDAWKKKLMENTRFGRDEFKDPMDHPVLDREEFSTIRVAKGFKDRAWRQIGSSGGGNHFVEIGVVEILTDDNEWGIKPGLYTGVLSHSGSRGMGAGIAQHYTQLAMRQTTLPQEARHLAWLDLDTELGQEYWLAMNLAGDYASACHHQIHRRMAKALGGRQLAIVENHHNFAWKELDADGNEVIVHRKGATPAGEGVMGIIPGTMSSHGFIVRGRGNPASLNSASHGAGRLMSRSQAKQTYTRHQMNTHLREHGIELIGSGVDEAPMVYKNIHQVMRHQQELVDVLGTFLPKIVRMCGDEKFMEAD